MKAIRSVTLADTPRGPLKIDDYGNAIIDVYVRRAEMKSVDIIGIVVGVYRKL